jgi:hypothetical protein
MPAINDTAYPRLRSTITPKELQAVYTPTRDERRLALQATKGRRARLSFLVLLRTVQRLGYFVHLADVPISIIQHIARSSGLRKVPLQLSTYDRSGTRQRHITAIRAYLQLQPWGRPAVMWWCRRWLSPRRLKRISPISSIVRWRSWCASGWSCPPSAPFSRLRAVSGRSSIIPHIKCELL